MLLQKRSNGVFYFRWVYPPALRKLLGKRELIKSLRSTSKSQALARTGAYYMLVEKYKAQLLQLGRVVGASTPLFLIYGLTPLLSKRLLIRGVDISYGLIYC